MSNVKNVIIAGAVLFASVSVAMAQTKDHTPAIVGCLDDAQSHYAYRWQEECVARSLGSNNCRLPNLVASQLKLERSSDQSYCFSAGSAGVLDYNKEPIVMPGAGGVVGSASDDPPLPEAPRRKFWISPQ